MLKFDALFVDKYVPKIFQLCRIINKFCKFQAKTDINKEIDELLFI